LQASNHGHLAAANTNPREYKDINSKPVFENKASSFTLEKDVILPIETQLHFDECLAKIRWHRKIYEDWGFSAIDPLGRTVILNFYGPPGTGKTLAAEAFAGTLGLSIIQISLADLESKYLGETAKNIQASFKAANESGGVLFFDEADTLLGKRLSNVTQGIDNEVNTMRSTLLIELERFDGIVIFATNFVKNYDEAFLSRITHQVPFQLPDFDARERLWLRMLLPSIPMQGDRTELAKKCAELSEGFSGRELRTCMRLALPKALMSAEVERSEPFLSINHLHAAIAQIKQAKKDTLSVKSEMSKTEISTIKNALGIRSNLTEKDEV